MASSSFHASTEEARFFFVATVGALACAGLAADAAAGAGCEGCEGCEGGAWVEATGAVGGAGEDGSAPGGGEDVFASPG